MSQMPGPLAQHLDAVQSEGNRSRVCAPTFSRKGSVRAHAVGLVGVDLRADDELAAVGLVDVDVQVAETMTLSRNGLSGSVTQRLERVRHDRQARRRPSARSCRRPAGRRVDDRAGRGSGPASVWTPVTLCRPSTPMPVTSVYGWMSMPFCRGALRVAPDHGVVADDPAGRVVQRREDREAACRSLRSSAGTSPAISSGSIIRAVDAQQSWFVSARTRRPVMPRLGVGQRQVAVLAEQHVSPGPRTAARTASRTRRRRRRPPGAVVGADDRGVAPAGAGAQVAPLQDRDVLDAVLAAR